MSTQMSSNRMYVIFAPVIVPLCLKISKEVSNLWHYRYPHLIFKGLSTLAKKEMVKGLPIIEEIDDKCSDCAIGKQHRNATPKMESWRATKKLELIDSDICGPINPTSNAGSRYFITFIDDYSRKTWIYLLQDKSSAFDIFRRFKALVEKESNCQIQCLRTDRGGEFTSASFNDFCSINGIKRQLTTAYTPHLNGVSERKNRTLMNMVRSMLFARKVPMVFWPEAVVWATHVLNRSPTLSVKDMTPEEAWSDLKPTVHYFRVFGCIAYAHVSDAQRKKLDDKGIKCVYLGVSNESKGYKLFDPLRNKVIISKDVVFEEEKGWDWNEKQKEPSLQAYINDEKDDSAEEEDAAVHIEENATNNEIDECSDDADGNVQSGSSNEEDEETTRIRKPLAWSKDYVLGREAEEESNLQTLAFFSNKEDPATYEEAAKFNCWKEAMDQEIEAIERNDT